MFQRANNMIINKKPIIGIVSKHFMKKETRPNMYIRDEIKQAIFDNGGIAIGILLPKDEKDDVSDEWKDNLNKDEFNNLISQIKLCNGIVFQGGGACDNYEMIVVNIVMIIIYQLLGFVVGKMLWLGL